MEIGGVEVVMCWENCAQCFAGSVLGKGEERGPSSSMLTWNRAKFNNSKENTHPTEETAIAVRDAAARGLGCSYPASILFHQRLAAFTSLSAPSLRAYIFTLYIFTRISADELSRLLRRCNSRRFGDHQCLVLPCHALVNVA